jgi:hypothetical protein
MSVESLDQRQLEQIVVSVITRLMTPTASPRAEPTAATVPRSSPPFIADRVITQELLVARVTDGKSVRVSSRAILTPSARDFLRIHGIECVRDSTNDATSPTAIRTPWVALVSKTTSTVTSAVGSLRENGGNVEQRLVGTSVEAAQQAIGILCRGDAVGVVVFTDEPEATACLANRNATVRAAVVTSVPQATSIQRRLGVNLAAINPVGQSFFELRNLLRVVTSGNPTAPPTWS